MKRACANTSDLSRHASVSPLFSPMNFLNRPRLIAVTGTMTTLPPQAVRLDPSGESQLHETRFKFVTASVHLAEQIVSA
jgi:hypothetical protein